MDRDVENTETLTEDGGEYETDLTNSKKQQFKDRKSKS